MQIFGTKTVQISGTNMVQINGRRYGATNTITCIDIAFGCKFGTNMVYNINNYINQIDLYIVMYCSVIILLHVVRLNNALTVARIYGYIYI